MHSNYLLFVSFSVNVLFKLNEIHVLYCSSIIFSSFYAYVSITKQMLKNVSGCNFFFMEEFSNITLLYIHFHDIPIFSNCWLAVFCNKAKEMGSCKKVLNSSAILPLPLMSWVNVKKPKALFSEWPLYHLF